MSKKLTTCIRTNVLFGKEYKDLITGFKGVCTSIAKHQFGCIRIGLTPKMGKDGKNPDSVYFDEESLVGIKAVKDEPITTGGPTPDPTRNADPS